ncbi:aminotransferase [Streptomyces sp. NBRC 110611]|uniref:DegT/DnrJ/EryC1/StrS family aminotransferase n=1 Tax=Streptomyces sp. NBRC 110611 TaxID=1621259 RepID=UPI00082DCD79|nr:DegT/DnrJ/EryC1/StrS family aminotransferase [Streptomyces sp. NBRC 110611]GAU69667.1 aminotransferase [Streptomyces sp. NBRC 110611]
MGTLETLELAGVGAGDEVVVPAYGNAEVARAVVALGVVPVFADVDGGSYCLDPAAVSEVVTGQTVAVVAVHRFGRRADVGRLREVGERHGLLALVVEEPGADPGGTEPGVAELRRACVSYLDSRLRGVRTPEPAVRHTYERYVVRVPGNGRPDRDAFARALRAKGVACTAPVPVPLYRMPELRRDVFLPETERAADETLALPVYAGMSRRELQRMVSACNALGGLLQPAL